MVEHERSNYCFYGRGENQLKAYNEQLRESEQKINQQKEAAKLSREFAPNIIDTVRQPLLVLDKNLKVITTNQYFFKLNQQIAPAPSIQKSIKY